MARVKQMARGSEPKSQALKDYLARCQAARLKREEEEDKAEQERVKQEQEEEQERVKQEEEEEVKKEVKEEGQGGVKKEEGVGPVKQEEGERRVKKEEGEGRVKKEGDGDAEEEEEGEDEEEEDEDEEEEQWDWRGEWEVEVKDGPNTEITTWSLFEMHGDMYATFDVGRDAYVGGIKLDDPESTTTTFTWRGRNAQDGRISVPTLEQVGEIELTSNDAFRGSLFHPRTGECEFKGTRVSEDPSRTQGYDDYYDFDEERMYEQRREAKKRRHGTGGGWGGGGRVKQVARREPEKSRSYLAYLKGCLEARKKAAAKGKGKKGKKGKKGAGPSQEEVDEDEGGVPEPKEVAMEDWVGDWEVQADESKEAKTWSLFIRNNSVYATFHAGRYRGGLLLDDPEAAYTTFTWRGWRGTYNDEISLPTSEQVGEIELTGKTTFKGTIFNPHYGTVEFKGKRKSKQPSDQEKGVRDYNNCDEDTIADHEEDYRRDCRRERGQASDTSTDSEGDDDYSY